MRLHGLPALLAYTILACIATHPLWQRLASAVPSDIGDPLLNTWIMAWDAHALLTQPGRLFDANIFFPLTNALAYSEHLLGSAITSLPILLLTGQPVVAYNLAFWLSYVLGGWGVYLLVRRHTRRPWAAFLAGIAFAYAPYRLTAFSHLQMLTLQWLPFALLCLDSALSRGSRDPAIPARHWLAFILLLWLQIATSWHLAVFTAVTVAAYALGACLRLPPARRLRGLAACALALLVVAALTWPLVPPYLALLSQLQASRPVELAAQFGAHLGDYLAAPPANPIFGPLTEAFSRRPGFTEENFLFVGLVGPLLALLGLTWALRGGALRRTRILVLTWTAIALGAWVLTWGPFLTIGGIRVPLPYALLSGLSPIFGLIRVPPRWMAAASLPLAALVGFGVAALLDWVDFAFGAGRRLLAPGLAALMGVALLAEGWGAPLGLAPVGALEDLPAVYRWLAAQPGDFGVLEWPLYVAPRPEYPETRRLYASAMHWKRLVNGYSGMTPARQTALDAALRGFPDDPALAALRDLARQGVRYLIVHSGEQGFDRDRWESVDRWRLARSTTTAPVFDTQSDYVYALNAWGDALVTAPDSIPTDARPSSRPRPADARWDNGVTLLAYEPHLDVNPPYVDLYWRAAAPPARDATVFVHLLDAGGTIVAQADAPPVDGHYALSQWAPGEIIRDRHAWAPPAALNGVTLRLGLYYPETQARVPIIDPSGHTTGDFVLLPVAAPTP